MPALLNVVNISEESANLMNDITLIPLGAGFHNANFRMGNAPSLVHKECNSIHVGVRSKRKLQSSQNLQGTDDAKASVPSH